MKVIFRILLLFVVVMSAACSDITTTNNGHATQKITNRSDCVSCSDRWKWSNGVATIEWFEGAYHYSERGFSFKTEIAGELTMDAKMNASEKTSWVCLWINEEFISQEYLQSKDYKNVSLGQVDKDIVVWIVGSNIVLKNIMITDVNTPDSQWDF